MRSPKDPGYYSPTFRELVFSDVGSDGEGLGTMWGEEMAKEMLGEAGFTNVEVKQLPHAPFNNYFVITKGWHQDRVGAAGRRRPAVKRKERDTDVFTQDTEPIASLPIKRPGLQPRKLSGPTV